MEQCNKRWKDYTFDRVDKHGNLIAEVPDYEDYYYSGWKAALEWLRTKGHTNDYGDEIIYKGVIDKELGDE